MTQESKLTIESFVEQRPEFPDGGRWSELREGHPVHLMAPDEEHGLSVMNITRALAEYAGRHPQHAGYACFEIGLILSRDPDTLHCPAISYFTAGTRFAHSNDEVTQTAPALVIEVASTSDRRRNMSERVEQYHEFGAESVWVVDPRASEVVLIRQRRPVRTMRGDEIITNEPALPDFSIPVPTIFAQPTWWTG